MERAGVIEVEVFDWNYLQHVAQQLTPEAVGTASRPPDERIAALEKEMRELRRAASALGR